MNSRKIKLGFVPTRRMLNGPKFCNKDKALERKVQVEDMLRSKGVDYVGIDFLNQEGLIYSELDAKAVADKMIQEGVDALFMPHVNFGCEDAVAKVAKLVNKPVLLWGLRDHAPDKEDGQRLTDTQCGLFATGKVLKQYGVPFTYITNSFLDDDVFVRGFDAFLAVANVVKSFRGMRIGQIGTRPAEFLSVKCNELDLLERFGIEIIPTTMIDLQYWFNDFLNNKKSVVQQQVDHFRDTCDIQIDEDGLYRTAALKCAIKSFAEDKQLTAVAAQCWNPMNLAAGIRPCFVFSELTGEGIPVACELDIHGAITSVIAQAATNWSTPSFLADLTIRHPENDNAELLWHCGVFPKSLCASPRPAIANSFDGDRPAVASYEVRGGDITISRFDCDRGNYQLLMGHCKGTEGPDTMGAYVWVEFKDLPEWEHKFVYGPYIHHCIGIHGKLSHIYYEACKYIPGLSADPVDPKADQLQKFFR